MEIDQTGIQVKGYYNDTLFSLLAGDGENISWRNIFGGACLAIEKSIETLYVNAPLVAGIYNIVVTDDSDPYYVNVYSGSGDIPLAQALIAENLRVFPGVLNYHIIPGLTITLADSIYINQKFQIIVGGRWLDSEERIIKSTIFDPLPAKTVPSPTIKLNVKNNSGKDLDEVYVTILNSIQVQQDQYSADIVTIPDPRLLYVDEGPFSDVEGEQLVRLTSDVEPMPCRVTARQTIDYSPSQSSPYYPFSTIGGTVNGSYRKKGWLLAPQGSGTGLSYDDPDTAPSLHYDFGKGNEVCFNRIGIATTQIQNLLLQASNDDMLEPFRWESLLAWTGESGYYYSPDWITVRYKNFINSRSFRHYRIVVTEFSADYIAIKPDYLPRISRLEFLYIESQDNYVPYRNRPFISWNRKEELQPVSENGNNNYSVVSVDTVGAETFNVKIDGIGYDVRDEDNDQLYAFGEGLPLSNLYSFRFPDDTPLPGFLFTINEDIVEGEFAKVWITNGTSVFQKRIYGDDAWQDGKSRLLLTGETDETGQMSNGSSCDIQVRANPSQDIEESDVNPSAGILCVYGISNSDYNEAQTAIIYDTAINSAATDGCVRIKISGLDVLGDEIRFKFRSLNHLSVSEAYFGTSQPETANYYRFPGRVPLSFEGNAYFEKIGENSQWSDWLPYAMNGDDSYLLSYGGPFVRDSYSNAEEPFLSYIRDDQKASYITWDDTYTEDIKIYDLEEIQIRNKYRCLTTIPLVCPVRKGVDNFNLNVTLLPIDISTVLSSFGISWEEIT